MMRRCGHVSGVVDAVERQRQVDADEEQRREQGTAHEAVPLAARRCTTPAQTISSQRLTISTLEATLVSMPTTTAVVGRWRRR